MDRADPEEAWPDWPITGYAAGELARYVSTDFTSSLVPAGITAAWQWPDGSERVRRIYEELRSRRIPYAREQWNPARLQGGSTAAVQRIRGPHQVAQGPATCIDLALVFAGIALSADLRPLIGYRAWKAPHALVIVDVRAPLSDQDGARRTPILECTERPGEPGVWDSLDGTGTRVLEELTASGNWLIVDIYKAAATDDDPHGSPFDWASGKAAAAELCDDEAIWTLVDVDTVAGDLVRKGLRHYNPPRGQAIPPIHGYLSATPAFTTYKSRQDLTKELEAVVRAREHRAAPDRPEPASGTVVVLQGPSGYGKSMLAHQLARAADGGCGWFLNATDAPVLTSSLAQAERVERGWLGEQPDMVEERQLAADALARLRGSALPWVVVLDNCDVPPDAPGLADRIPRPAHPGQVVVITTTCERWGEHAGDQRWTYRRLPPLAGYDLTDLGLPTDIADAIGGRPLIAHPLMALSVRGTRLSADIGAETLADGPGLVWSLVRAACADAPGATALSRTLAWCPPEALDAAAVLRVARIADASAIDTLDRLRFLTRQPGLAGQGGAIQMHRLFAQAVRDQTWRDDPVTAAAIISRLLSSDDGHALFIGAADTTALRRLEGASPDTGEAARAAEYLRDVSSGGLLWHGLGHIRERRGPVPDSGPPFERALQDLEPVQYSYQVAEAIIGLARIANQARNPSDESLTQARAAIGRARELLATLGDVQARQLSEQGNALSWLIAQKLAQRTPNLTERAVLLEQVRDSLWLSYEQRLRIARGLSDETQVGHAPPGQDDGLGPERAYYNLGGINVLLARLYYELAVGEVVLAGADDATWQVRSREALGQADTVYRAVRGLRETRYQGHAHPHLAACVHGQAIVGYYRAVLLGELAGISAAIGFVATAFEQRRKVADEAVGRRGGVLADNDVGKSAELMLKVAVAARWFAQADPAAGRAVAMQVVEQAMAELTAAPGGPGAA